ncbi:hypothetical protein CMI37_01145 [Candidatus Pacearchaeota archaeon]|nr:hypothetical protein [Candidatus Pacearchaeota archaeon]|tara:strand:+ start:6016 stop:6792 length:777 start_codon:yes stop_codon:yes gene_type:complete
MANVPTTSWDEAEPLGSRPKSQGDDRIRELKTQIREVVDVDHKFDSSGQGATFGYHTAAHLIVSGSDPTTVSDVVIVYSKDPGDGDEELFVKDSLGNVIQMTDGGDINLSTAVLLTGDQTVAGVKTFSSVPVLPSSDPTADDEAARKKYVDDIEVRRGIPQMAIGTYTGDGTASQDITGVGIDLTSGTWLIHVGRTAGGNYDLISKASVDSGINSYTDDNSAKTDGIQAGLSDGFRVGTGYRVNDNGDTYRYTIWKLA